MTFASTITGDDDLVEVSETPPASQDIARLRAELQREEEAQRVEAADIAEANELKVKIKRLQAKRGISVLQHHAHDEELFGGRRFFLHHGNELSQFFSLSMMFSAVNRKHFAEIFRCTFMPEQLHKLVNDYSVRNTLGIDAENGLIRFDIRGMSHLTRCFEVYCQIVLELALESVYREFNKAFFMYRCHSNFLLTSYIFDSVLAFHKIIMYARINEIQDDLEGWRIIDKRMEDNYLIRRNRDSGDSKPRGSKSDKPTEGRVPYGYCKRFNHDLECQGCSYKHQCAVCQSPSHSMKKCSQTFSFSGANRTPIDTSRRQ